jgi:hypothetical protein
LFAWCSAARFSEVAVRRLWPFRIAGGGTGTPKLAGAAGRCARSSRSRVELAQPASKDIVNNARAHDSKRAGRLPGRRGGQGISGDLFFIEGVNLGPQRGSELLFVGKSSGGLGGDLSGGRLLARNFALVSGFLSRRLFSPLRANAMTGDHPANNEGRQAPADRGGHEGDNGAPEPAEEGEKKGGHYWPAS